MRRKHLGSVCGIEGMRGCSKISLRPTPLPASDSFFFEISVTPFPVSLFLLHLLSCSLCQPPAATGQHRASWGPVLNHRCFFLADRWAHETPHSPLTGTLGATELSKRAGQEAPRLLSKVKCKAKPRATVSLGPQRSQRELQELSQGACEPSRMR